MKKELENLRKTFNRPSSRNHDPVQFIYRYKKQKDQEIAGFLAAMFAYGRVEQILKSVDKLLRPLGKSPSKTLADRSIRFELPYKDFKHRLNKGTDAAILLYTLAEILERHGSLQNLFGKCLIQGGSFYESISLFMETLRQTALKTSKSKKIKSRHVMHLLPSPSNKSACKRVNLFLKWMIRKDNIDPGTWRDKFSHMKKDLVIPLDVHIARHARLSGMTSRKSNDWKTAVEVTDFLKQIDSSDPLKYDFAICHAGMKLTRTKSRKSHA